MVVVFEDTMVDLVYELDDREIYNDIRSEVQVSETTTIIDDPGTPAEHDTDFTSERGTGWLNPGESQVLICYCKTIHEGKITSWYDALVSKEYRKDFAATQGECSIAGGVWWAANSEPAHCGLDYPGGFTIVCGGGSGNTCQYAVTNTGGKGPAYCRIYGRYRYISADEIPPTEHEETKYSTMTVRTIDDNSIRKYGRRVMNLTWPLGATEAEAQNMVNAYCSRYSEPVSRLEMTLIGSTDAIKIGILTREVSNMIRVINSELGLDDNYFINFVNIDAEANRIPISKFVLEEARPEEESGYAKVGEAIVGESIIG